MSSIKPGIVLCLGGWHQLSQHELLQDALERAGYKVHTVDYPTVGGEQPHISAAADIAAVRLAATNFVRSDQDVVLVMSSYGGLVGSNAAQGLLPSDSKNGRGVISLVYCASFVLDAGESVLSHFGNAHPPWVRNFRGTKAGGWLYPDNPPFDPGVIFCNDCSSAVRDARVSKLRVHSELAVHTPASWAAWKVVKSNYLICELDQVLPLKLQKEMAGRAGGQWCLVETIRAGHSPFVSKPGELARFVRKCAGEAFQRDQQLLPLPVQYSTSPTQPFCIA